MPDTPATAQFPLILFDGVCNFCNASINWIIDRDPRARFRFAALQSPEGRAALEKAGAPANLPDSMVLIDDRGLHTRSDAAIQIARGLNFPWNLATVTRVLPRSIRDRLYDLVARNRYRWFGRQNACMLPTPELRSRFLSSGASDSPAIQDPPATPSSSNLTAQPRRRLAILKSFPERFVLTYLLLYISCSPLSLPGLSWLTEKYIALPRAATVWTARHFFATTITVFPNGSGDTTYNYIELVVIAATAVLVAAVWSLARRGAPVSVRLRDLINVVIRYYLGATLLGYGWAKVFAMQMPFPAADRLIGTIGDASPMGLLWTFIGASTPYQIFTGVGEVLAGILLLWRRTTLLGALVAAGVLVNVVTLNFCYDVPVKIYSSHLLVMALFLIAPHAARLAALLVFNLPAQPATLNPCPIRPRWVRWLRATAKIAFIFAVAVWPLIENNADDAAFQAFSTPPEFQGVYRVESFTRDGLSDRALPDADRWVRVGIGTLPIGAIQRADGSSLRQLMKIDLAAHTLTITRRGENDPITLALKYPQPGVLELEGKFEGGQIAVRMRRTPDLQPLLTTRGFHWINEFPLNR